MAREKIFSYEVWKEFVTARMDGSDYHIGASAIDQVQSGQNDLKTWSSSVWTHTSVDSISAAL